MKRANIESEPNLFTAQGSRTQSYKYVPYDKNINKLISITFFRFIDIWFNGSFSIFSLIVPFCFNNKIDGIKKMSVIIPVMKKTFQDEIEVLSSIKKK